LSDLREAALIRPVILHDVGRLRRWWLSRRRLGLRGGLRLGLRRRGFCFAAHRLIVQNESGNSRTSSSVRTREWVPPWTITVGVGGSGFFGAPGFGTAWMLRSLSGL